MNDLIAGRTGRDFARPPDREGNPQATFEAGKQGAAPGAGRSLNERLDRPAVVSVISRLRPVIGGEDEDGVVADP